MAGDQRLIVYLSVDYVEICEAGLRLPSDHEQRVQGGNSEDDDRGKTRRQTERRRR